MYLCKCSYFFFTLIVPLVLVLYPDLDTVTLIFCPAFNFLVFTEKFPFAFDFTVLYALPLTVTLTFALLIVFPLTTFMPFLHLDTFRIEIVFFGVGEVTLIL